MEDNNKKTLPKESNDNGVLAAILLTICMVAAMVVIKHYIG